MELKDIIEKAEIAEELRRGINIQGILLKGLSLKLQTLLTETIPAMMLEEGIQNFTLKSGTAVVIKNIVAGSLPSGGAIKKAKGDDKQELIDRLNGALTWLRKNKAGDIIKNEVSCTFAAGKESEAKEIFSYLNNQGLHPSQESTVHAQTLNAFLREALADGKDVPSDLFKLYTGQVADFKLPESKTK